MIAVILSILDRFAWLFRLLRVDYDQLRAIVGIKLLMDTRRSTVTFGKQQPEGRNMFLFSLFFNCLMGGMMSLFVFLFPLASTLTLLHGFIMMMIVMSLIADFSSVLLDTSDTTVVFPRPVGSRTLLVARITHIIVYLTQVWLSLMIIPCLVFIYTYSIWSGLLFLCISFLSVVLSVVLTCGIYLILMNFASEEKLKTIINYAQIAMAILFMCAYQLLPRVMDLKNLELAVEFTAWSLLIPPMWMSALQEMIQLKTVDSVHVALGVLAIIVPLYGMYLVTTTLSPFFSRKISDLATSSSAQETVKAPTLGIWQSLSRGVSFSAIEQASFLFVSAITSRDRKFKLRIYPALGYTLILAVLVLLPSSGREPLSLQHLSESKRYFFALYFVFLVAQSAIYESGFSEEFRSAWIYHAAPITHPGEILSGSLKCLFLKYFVPLFSIVSVVLICIWGTQIIPDVALAFANNLCAALIILIIGKKDFPFSLEPTLRNQSGSIVRTLLILFLAGILCTTHYFIATLNYGTVALLILATALLIVMERLIRKMSWDDFRSP